MADVAVDQQPPQEVPTVPDEPANTTSENAENDDNWELHSLAIDERYAANLAVIPGRIQKFILEEFRLPDWEE